MKKNIKKFLCTTALASSFLLGMSEVSGMVNDSWRNNDRRLDLDIVKYLVENSPCSVECKYQYCANPLILTPQCNHLDIKPYLIEDSHCNVKETGRQVMNLSLLLTALKKGDLDTARRLIEEDHVPLTDKDITDCLDICTEDRTKEYLELCKSIKDLVGRTDENAIAAFISRSTESDKQKILDIALSCVNETDKDSFELDYNYEWNKKVEKLDGLGIDLPYVGSIIKHIEDIVKCNNVVEYFLHNFLKNKGIDELLTLIEGNESLQNYVLHRSSFDEIDEAIYDSINLISDFDKRFKERIEIEFLRRVMFGNVGELEGKDDYVFWMKFDPNKEYSGVVPWQLVAIRGDKNILYKFINRYDMTEFDEWCKRVAEAKVAYDESRYYWLDQYSRNAEEARWWALVYLLKKCPVPFLRSDREEFEEWCNNITYGYDSDILNESQELSEEFNEWSDKIINESSSNILNESQELKEEIKKELFVPLDDALKGFPFLHIASAQDNIEIVKYLVKNCHCSVEAKNRWGETPLHAASHGGCLDIVKYLVENCHANVESKNNNDATPLHYASFKGHLDIVQYLVEECHMNVEAKDWYGQTPLHIVAEKGHLDIVKYLVEECHMNVEAKDNGGLTPLHIVAEKGYLDIVKYLIEEGHAEITDEIIRDTKSKSIKAYLKNHKHK